MRLVASGVRDSLSALDDNARFRSVVIPHIDDAYRLAHWLTGNRTDAEDVVQESYLRWHATDPAVVRNAEAWLVAVTTRIAIDRLRRQHSRAKPIGARRTTVM